MKHLLLEPDFDAWRLAARHALQAGFKPEEIDLQDATVPTILALSLDVDDIPTDKPQPWPHTSKGFLEAAQVVAVHRDPQRWNLLYRLLYRLQDDHNLLKIETDDDVAQLSRLEAQVRRDLHKMPATQASGQSFWTSHCRPIRTQMRTISSSRHRLRLAP
jgi:hypothetical protein